MIRAIIIDDEQDARDGLSLLLKTHCSDVMLVATADSASDGINVIQLHRPDLVFLDVEMPHSSGFDILKNLPEKDFKTIFVTAYNHYALKAIKFSALDYLLKPVDVDELCAAVQKAGNSIGKTEKEQHQVLLENLSADKQQKLALPIKDGFQYIRLDHIIRIEGEGSYCTFYLEDGTKMTVSKNLGVYDDLLKKNNFYRTHQSHLINIAHVHRFLRTDGGTIIMSDKSTVPVSKRNKEGFNKAMQLE